MQRLRLGIKIVDQLGLMLEAGKPSTIDFTPTQSGVYEINCPMRMVNPSYIVVTN